MEEHSIIIELKNGNTHHFLKKADSKKQIIEEITNQHGGDWFHFQEKMVNYQVKKSEIISIGISLTREEVEKLETNN